MMVVIPKTGDPIFRMYTEDGHERLRLEVRDGYPVVQLRSATSVRARLALKQWEEGDKGAIVFDLFGEGKGGDSTPEPALWAHVNADGSSGFVVDYAGMDDRGDIDVHGGVKLTSGDIYESPRLAIWGRRCLNDHIPIVEMPERSDDGVRQDALNEIHDVLQRYADEHGLDTRQLRIAFDEICRTLAPERKT